MWRILRWWRKKGSGESWKPLVKSTRNFLPGVEALEIKRGPLGARGHRTGEGEIGGFAVIAEKSNSRK